jgi:hypothetical protein
MRLMPEAERLETLALLGRNRAEVEGALAALSITSDTQAAVRGAGWGCWWWGGRGW